LVAQLNSAFVRSRPGKIWPRLLAYTLFEGRPLTTRGRWINPLVFALYRLWARLSLPTHDAKPIFILGVGRSGTTALGSVLAAHKDVAYLNEPKALWHAALGDDDLIGSYSVIPGRYKMNKTDATAVKSRNLHRFYSAFLLFSGCSRIVDKYPELIFRTGLIDAIFPDARKIALVRNGTDICQSVQRWSDCNVKTTPAHTDDWWGRDRRKWRILVDEVVAVDPVFSPIMANIRAFDRHTDMAAVEWIVTMRQLLHLQTTGDQNLHIVRYEDLITRPRQATAEILRFCGLRDDEIVLKFAGGILARQTRYDPVKLDPSIQAIFDTTMESLNYPRLRAA